MNSKDKAGHSRHSNLFLKHKPEGMSDEEFVKHLSAASPVLRALARMIEQEIVGKEEVSELDYDSPSWSHKQADHNGFVRCARKIRKLLPQDQ